MKIQAGARVFCDQVPYPGHPRGQIQYGGPSAPPTPLGAPSIVLYCIKTLFKDTSPVNGALISTGGVYNVKNYKRYKEKEDYLQIGVTPDVMVKRSYNLFQIYIVLELSFKWLLNRCIDSASFVSIERLFHSLAPLYLKLFFRNSLLGLGRAKSV